MSRLKSGGGGYSAAVGLILNEKVMAAAPIGLCDSRTPVRAGPGARGAIIKPDMQVLLMKSCVCFEQMCAARCQLLTRPVPSVSVPV